MNNQIKQASTAQLCNYTITLSVNESLFSYIIVRHCTVAIEQSIYPLILLFSIKCLFSQNAGWRCVYSRCYFLSYCVLSYSGMVGTSQVCSHLFIGVFVCVSVCLAASGFSHKLVSACLAATSEAGSVCAVKCVHVCCVCGVWSLKASIKIKSKD